MAKKTRKVKWSVNDEPEDLQDFKSNDEIGKPPKGVYRLVIRRITLTENKNKDDMLKIVAEVDEKDKAKRRWNGYTFWENQNVTTQGAPFLKRFLTALGASWSDFRDRTEVSEIDGEDRVTKIGKVNFMAKKPVVVFAATKDDTSKYAQDNDLDRLIVSRWLPPKSSDADGADDDDVDEDGPSGNDDGDGANEPDIEAELNQLSDKQLHKRAGKHKIDGHEDMSRKKLIKAILKVEDPPF